MKSYDIALLKGDGVGDEIMQEALKVLDAISKEANFRLNYKECLIGGVAIDKEGAPLPEDTLKTCKTCDGVLLGAVGGPKWEHLSPEKRPEKGLLEIRSALNTYANLRPIKVFDELSEASTLKKEVVQGVDMMIVRELTSGIYFGAPRFLQKDKALNSMIYLKSEIQRIAKVAFEIAQKRRKKVCSVDKANVLEVSRLWRNVVDEISVQYPDVKVTHMLVDNAAMQLIRNPKQFDVILSGNIFGDILSDLASMISGSIGLLPSASLGGEVGLFEPIHGSAPDIAGKGIVNPIAMILSASLMLKYALNEYNASLSIDNAISKTLKAGYRTKDIASFGDATICSTQEIGSIIVDNL